MNYGLVAGLGCAVAMIILELWHPPICKIIAFLLVPMPLLSFIFARHAKALFLAMEHYFDPHLK